MLKVLVPTPITGLNFVSSVIAEPSGDDAANPWSVSLAYAQGQKVHVISAHRNYECLDSHQGDTTSSATVTLTIASPCVLTWTAHGKLANTAVTLTTNGALPTGLLPGVTYYVTSPSTNSFNLSAVPGGPAIVTTGTQTGTHTASTISTSPVDNTDLWLDLGPTNKWAMFDTYINTSTKLTTSVGTPELKAIVQPGVCNGVALLDIIGASSVSVIMKNGALTVFSQTQELDNTFISDWYMYYFEPFDVKTDVLFGPMPPYPNATIEVTVTPTSVGTEVQLGAAMFGNTVELGQLQYGATAGIIDYSKKETDEFGITTLVQRGYAKRATYTLNVDNSQIRRVFSTLAALRATPAVWIGVDDYSYTPLTVFGKYNDFGINVSYPTFSSCSLEIEGLL